jgi:putative cell wall-binding protein/murein tripeptide amidase MpaA
VSILLATTLLLSLAPVVPVASAADPQAVGLDRIAGADRYATAVAISQRLAPVPPVPVVYLVSGQDFPDALSAAPIARLQGGLVLLTTRDAMPPVVEAELVRLAPPRIVIVGGPTVVSDAVLARAQALLPGTVVGRIFGPDRFATSAALSAAAFTGTPPQVVFLASGLSFPDALAAGPVGARNGWPVLLTRPDVLPPQTAAELARLRPSSVVVVGGAGVVGAAVVQAVQALGIPVERVAGADRYATAAAVANRFLPGAQNVLVATGSNFPDALAGAPLAAAVGAPILLVPTSWVTPSVRDVMRTSHPVAIIALGGTGVVWDAVLNELAGWSDGRLQLPPPGPDYPSYDSRYTSPGEMLLALRVAEVAYPGLVQVFSIGKSYYGREIWTTKISDNVATDEAEPEVLIDALHHAREHLTVEQAMYMLRTLTADYGRDPYVTNLVNGREIFIIFALNPDGWAYDLTGNPYIGWRKNLQPNPGSAHTGTDPNRNYDYHWGCCGGSSGSTAAWNYRGKFPFSAPETYALANFVNSRVIGGKQQIRTHVTLHTNGELILYPYGYTKVDRPADMRADDLAVFRTMASYMASTNRYRAMQSSDLYITDGDQIDWMYGRHRIFSFTFELYPTEQVSSHADHEPPDEVIAAQTARNRRALLFLIDAAWCPWVTIGKQATYC